jgi:hypothetical protein
MRSVLTLLFIIFLLFSKGQDKLFYLDGTSKKCKVLSVNSEVVQLIDENGYESMIARSYIMMIEYKNGFIDVFNYPQDDSEIQPANGENIDAPKKDLRSSQFKHSYASINTLALTNADISGFYEYRPRDLPIMIGIMGAYNFNIRSTIQNNYINILANGKKNYDIGVTFNYLPESGDEDEEKIYIGAMAKYTDISFDVITIDSAGAPGSKTQILTYSKSKGSQLAFMATTSYQLHFGDGFFMRGIFGFGGFKLTGDYRKEYNYYANKNLQPAEQYHEAIYRPKIYLGVNVGFNF